MRGHYWHVSRLGLLLLLFLVVPVTMIPVLSMYEVLLDPWQLDAVTSGMVDLATGYGTVCFFCFFQALASQEVTKTV